jgi:hypothetical protein
VNFDPAFLLMKDRADAEVCFEVFEGFFDGDELDLVLPEGGGITR